MRGRFDVWAPLAERVRLSVGDEVVEMTRGDDDWWLPAGPVPDGEVDYGYLLDDDETVLPDPRSRRQPDGVHERSRTFDTVGVRLDVTTRWTGRQLAGLGGLRAAPRARSPPRAPSTPPLGRLDHLVELGVDLVELLPVNAFNGTHNWGYDGVLLVRRRRGVRRPGGVPALRRRRHAAGLGVVQDVVYNHLGPSGNYLPLFGPYLKSEGQTPGARWSTSTESGSRGGTPLHPRQRADVAARLPRRRAPARRRARARATPPRRTCSRSWPSRSAALSAHLRRPLTLIAESDLNDPRAGDAARGGRLRAGRAVERRLPPRRARGADRRDRAATTPTSSRSRRWRRCASAASSTTAPSPRSAGATTASRSTPRRCPPGGWSSANQNHDQVGNRAVGDRLTEASTTTSWLCAALLTLAGPFTPMLFQGEEWAASTPFQFFTSHPEPELGQATAAGRIREFEQMGWDPELGPRPAGPRDVHPLEAGLVGEHETVGTRGCSRRTAAWPSSAAPHPRSPTRRSAPSPAPPTRRAGSSRCAVATCSSP